MTNSRIRTVLLSSFLSLLVLQGFLSTWKHVRPQNLDHDLDVVNEPRELEVSQRPTGRHILGVEEGTPGKTRNLAEEVKKWQDAQDRRDYEDAKFTPKVEREEGERYTLGPKITDWNEQRAAYIRKHPGCNVGRNGGERMLLVTGSQPKMCANKVGDHFLLKSIKNKLDYCNLHGIDIFNNLAVFDSEMSGFWAKLPLIRRLMLTHPEVEWFWWMDSDAMFTDMSFELPMQRYRHFNLVLHGWEELVYRQKDWVGINTGSFLMRNNQWMLDLLDEWAVMGPKGSIRTEAGKLLTATLKGRPEFEADDQSALVWLLGEQRDRWAALTYLESSFYLHGYWAILVDKYEEMIEKFHPGLGDDRWPFVTHFVGCKPCGKLEELNVDDFRKCVHHMERAYNFADNQLLRPLGYEHVDLATTMVRPLNVTTHITEAAVRSAQRLQAAMEQQTADGGAA